MCKYMFLLKCSFHSIIYLFTKLKFFPFKTWKKGSMQLIQSYVFMHKTTVWVFFLHTATALHKTEVAANKQETYIYGISYLGLACIDIWDSGHWRQVHWEHISSIDHIANWCHLWNFCSTASGLYGWGSKSCRWATSGPSEVINDLARLKRFWWRLAEKEQTCRGHWRRPNKSNNNRQQWR